MAMSIRAASLVAPNERPMGEPSRTLAAARRKANELAGALAMQAAAEDSRATF
jgi:hypothetical protein